MCKILPALPEHGVERRSSTYWLGPQRGALSVILLFEWTKEDSLLITWDANNILMTDYGGRSKRRPQCTNWNDSIALATNAKVEFQYSLERIKDHLIKNGREPTFRVQRGLGDRDSSDDKWEQEFRRLSRAHDGHLDAGLDMQGMIKDVIWEFDDPPPNLPTPEGQLHDIVMDAFSIVDELDDELDDKPLGDNGCSNLGKEIHDDPCTLEETIEEVYHEAKSSVLAATILIMTLCTIHGVSNKFAD